jgi:Cu-Zn family superoxide dismutase
MFTMRLSVLYRLSAASLSLSLVACGIMPDMPTFNFTNTEGLPQIAEAKIMPTEGNQVTGTVRFVAKGNDTLVDISLKNLSPGPHGIHIHERGDCSAPDGLSAGAHFNPTDTPHGGFDGPHHLGDLGNIVAGTNGTVTLNFHVSGLKLSGEPNIIGRAVIIHAAADDLKTQPTGNSGKRLACGVIDHS